MTPRGWWECRISSKIWKPKKDKQFFLKKLFLVSNENMGKLGNFRVPPQKIFNSTIFSINKGLLSFEIRQLDNGTALTNIHINKGPGKEC